MNRSVVNAVSVIGKMGGAERHFPDDKKMGKAVTGLESESVTAHEVSNNSRKIYESVLPNDNPLYILKDTMKISFFLNWIHGYRRRDSKATKDNELFVYEGGPVWNGVESIRQFYEFDIADMYVKQSQKASDLYYDYVKSLLPEMTLKGDSFTKQYKRYHSEKDETGGYEMVFDEQEETNTI